MTPEQAKRLAALQDRLLDTVFREADPENWIGGNTPTAELDRDARGDRYWCMKVAAQAVHIYARLDSISGQNGAIGNPRDGEDLDDEIKRSEREAKKILARVQDRMPKRDAKA
jgi:hypothetical protein